MSKELKVLASMRYPGRLIMIGMDPDAHELVVYAVTGRSPSSQARKIAHENSGLWIKPTDEEVLRQGQVDLLIYPAVIFHNGIIVSNGKQTIAVKEGFSNAYGAAGLLAHTLREWEYEPDQPTYTPRVSGCVLSGGRAALSIIKRGSRGLAERSFYEVPLEAGRGKMVATYQGENRNPLPAFSGEPRDVVIEGKSTEEVVEAVYEALKPPAGEADFRVAVAAVKAVNLDANQYEIAVINRWEREVV